MTGNGNNTSEYATKIKHFSLNPKCAMCFVSLILLCYGSFRKIFESIEKKTVYKRKMNSCCIGKMDSSKQNETKTKTKQKRNERNTLTS